jgi:hypothetical protein
MDLGTEGDTVLDVVAGSRLQAVSLVVCHWMDLRALDAAG